MLATAASIFRVGSGFQPPAWAANFHSAWLSARAGNGQAHIAVYGDSVSAGFYANTPFYTNSFVSVAGDAIDAATGVSTGTGMVVVRDNSDVRLGENRIGETGSWTDATTSGYYAKNRRGTASSTMTFAATCESFRVQHIEATAASTSTYTLSVDGGDPVVVNPVIPSGFGTGFGTIDAGGLGSHTLTITAGSNALLLIGVEGIANGTTGIKTSRLGDSGAPVSRLIVDTFGSSSLFCTTALAPDLAVLVFGINDAANGVSTATFKSQYVTAIDAFKAEGSDVLLMVPPPPATGTVSAVTWGTFVDAIHELAVENTAGIVDITERWVSRAESVDFYYDTVHPNQAGHADIGAALSTVVLAAINA